MKTSGFSLFLDSCFPFQLGAGPDDVHFYVCREVHTYQLCSDHTLHCGGAFLRKVNKTHVILAVQLLPSRGALLWKGKVLPVPHPPPPSVEAGHPVCCLLPPLCPAAPPVRGWLPATAPHEHHTPAKRRQPAPAPWFFGFGFSCLFQLRLPRFLSRPLHCRYRAAPSGCSCRRRLSDVIQKGLNK